MDTDTKALRNQKLALNGLTPKEIAKPIIKKRTTLGQAFDLFYKESLPIHYFCNQQAEKNKKIKI